MKALLYIFLFSLPFIGIAQNDTLIINNNYKWKVGVKGLFEKTRHLYLDNHIYNFGLQAIYKLGSSKSSIESGIYHYTRNDEGEYVDTIYSLPPYNHYIISISYRNIQIPIKYRLDTKIIYFTIGFYGEYFLGIDVNSKIKAQIVNNTRKSFYLGYTSSIGFEKAFSSHFSLSFEAQYTSNLDAIQNTLISPWPNIGIGIGINYKILKH